MIGEQAADPAARMVGESYKEHSARAYGMYRAAMTDLARTGLTVDDTTSLRDLVRGMEDLHRPKGTSHGVRCSQCAVWRNGRLTRASWPCDTIQLVQSLRYVYG